MGVREKKTVKLLDKWRNSWAHTRKKEGMFKVVEFEEGGWQDQLCWKKKRGSETSCKNEDKIMPGTEPAQTLIVNLDIDAKLNLGPFLKI